MNCPPGQKYNSVTKRCQRRNILPGSKGRSQSPCHDGKVWNPAPAGRKCVRREIYEQIFGAGAAHVASVEQKRLRLTRMQRVEQRPPARIISPVVAAGPSPANKAGLEFDIGEPRVHATMPPGLSRSEMVEWLTKHCRNTSDPISLDEYADMELKDLRSLVRLGSGFCYTADGLTSHIKSAVERDLPVKNILNPGYRLDARDFGAIEKQGRLLRKTYKLPTREAEIPAAHYKLFIDVVAEPNYKYVFLYDNRKLKKVAGGKVDYTPAIPDGGWLGYIPAAGTDELEKLIKKAHKVGRLFTKAERPFKCCRVHVKKSKEYWTGDVATKISAMEEEIRGIL